MACDEQLAERIKEIPVGYAAEPSDIAEIVAFLASRRNRFMTGETVIASYQSPFHTRIAQGSHPGMFDCVSFDLSRRLALLNKTPNHRIDNQHLEQANSPPVTGLPTGIATVAPTHWRWLEPRRRYFQKLNER